MSSKGKHIRKEISLPKDAMFLFNEGKNYQAYKLLGAHRVCDDKRNGYSFCVWAPNAKSVSVVCDKNGWDRNINPMELYSQTGIWFCYIDGVDKGEKYKFSIETGEGHIFLKADPFAIESEVRPANASITAEPTYSWNDDKWMEKRKGKAPYDKPINIYEMHFGSWKKHNDGTFFSYSEMAEELIPYIKEMGYTHIELLPICEYPFDGSWGYQICGYYSVNSRYGSPIEFKRFIDRCHMNGIGVIMDWVPAHFPKDEHGLAMFDGTPLFEHPDSRLGEHKEWGTLVFNWEKTEIHSFLISNAIFWLEEYHIDGLRVDAVSSMLYLDYNRPEGEWIPNSKGGKENLFAIEFLQKLNVAVFERFPNIMMIAEESTAWEGVTRPVYADGLGFNFKWNMGWMNDVLKYMSMDPFYRGANHDLLTFSMMYAYCENYILPLSHDEVVHGKQSLINKMYGTYEQKFAGLKLLYLYMYAHPGKKLLFMGGELGQFTEWKFDEQLDWMLLDFETHKKLKNFVEDLNKFYRKTKSMHENDSDWDGFTWINESDREHSVISFMRTSRSKRDKTIVVANFSGIEYDEYEIEVPLKGDYEIVLSTDSQKYGGETEDSGIVKAKLKKGGNFKYTISLNLPPLTGVYIKKKRQKRGS